MAITDLPVRSPSASAGRAYSIRKLPLLVPPPPDSINTGTHKRGNRVGLAAGALLADFTPQLVAVERGTRAEHVRRRHGSDGPLLPLLPLIGLVLLFILLLSELEPCALRVIFGNVLEQPLEIAAVCCV